MDINQELRAIVQQWTDFISNLDGDIVNDQKVATQIVTTFGPMSEELSYVIQSDKKYRLAQRVLELAADLEWQDYPTDIQRNKDWDELKKIVKHLSTDI